MAGGVGFGVLRRHIGVPLESIASRKLVIGAPPTPSAPSEARVWTKPCTTRPARLHGIKRHGVLVNKELLTGTIQGNNEFPRNLLMRQY